MKMALQDLPEELTTLILVKLPVKCLLRSKCVRKSWYALINSPQFIRLHRSSSSPQLVFIHRVDKEEEEEEEPRHALSFFSYETLDALGDDIHVPISSFGANHCGKYVWLSGSCDGLVCIHNHYDTDYFYDKTDEIVIWNPAIREFRSLFVPDSSVFSVIQSVAFGSDPSTGQFKVVMIVVPSGAYCDREAKVYDFKTDSWRDTGVVIPAPFFYSRRAISLNGVLHWCSGHLDILTFHLSDEVSGSIPLPDYCDPSQGKQLYVSSKSQQLSLVVHDWEGRYEISVMTEYGVKESWTRLFRIGPLPNNINSEPLEFSGEQQLLFQTKNAWERERQLVSCDLQDQSLRYFPIFRDVHVIIRQYSESLVSVHGL